MLQERPSKWTAFLLSLMVPGSGQLLAGSATALFWFTLVALASALFAPAASSSSPGWICLLQLPLWVGLCLASAWHARGLLERQPSWTVSRCSRPTVACRAGHGRAIRATLRIETSNSPNELWRRVSDIETFLTIDPFHERITLMREHPEAGVDVVLHHDALGRRFDRFGRILWWRDGEGFAISDLSARDPQRGFPHVFTYRIEASGEDVSTLHVEITGRWTSRWLPVWFGRLWIGAICQYHALLLSHAL